MIRPEGESRIELVEIIPRSGQLYREARDLALLNFAELLVQAGVIVEEIEPWHDGKWSLTLKVME